MSYFGQSSYLGSSSYGEEAPLPMHGAPRHSFQGPSSGGYLATGWVEQLRRSKMQKIWKPVRLSLTERDMCLWVQRDNQMGQTETLQRIPLSSVRRVGLVDEYMGERRFCIMVPDNLDDPQVMFRCDQPAAANKWITALQTAQEHAKYPNRPASTPKQERARPQVTPSPPPAAPPKPAPDLLSFHVVAPTTPAAVAPPPPPKPLGAADFDPMRQGGGGRPASAPVSAPAPAMPYRPPAAPHSAGAPWQHQQQAHYHHPQYHQQQPPQQHRQTSIRQAVLHHWALAPPHRQDLRMLDQLVTTVQTTFALTQGGHAWKCQWTPIPYDDLCTAHVLDADKVDKAVRKLRAFLHPDKWPADLDADSKFLCQLLWEILQSAQEKQRRS